MSFIFQIKIHALAEPFLYPVDKKVPHYYEEIKYPIGDLTTVKFML